MSIVASLSVCLLLGQKGASFDASGTWHPHLHQDQQKLQSASKEMREQYRQAAAAVNETWVLVFRPDHTYVLPSSKAKVKFEEEGTWSVKGSTLTMKVIKQDGKKVSKSKHAEFQIDKDGNTLSDLHNGVDTPVYLEFFRRPKK